MRKLSIANRPSSTIARTSAKRAILIPTPALVEVGEREDARDEEDELVNLGAGHAREGLKRERGSAKCNLGIRTREGGLRNRDRDASSRETPFLSRNGGRGGIRTRGRFNPTLDFESSALNRTQPPFRCRAAESSSRMSVCKREDRCTLNERISGYLCYLRARLVCAMSNPASHFTFLFTDIEGSSRLWEEDPDAMASALARHDTLLNDIFASHGGDVFKTMGDSVLVAFRQPNPAVRAVIQAQKALIAQDWETLRPLRVRAALHRGPAEQRNGDYFGPTLNRTARLLSAGHGGQTLLSRTAREDLALPDGVELRDLGERRLRDLSRPERIFQLLAPDLPSEFPPLRSLEVLPNNLPAQLTTFIGRERELADVKRLVQSGRLVTLTGPGGTGKTRLSLQVAAELLESFADGVWLVELATLSDPELLATTVAAALGARATRDRPIEDTLLDYLRSKRLLLLLDNCEHLVAACAQLAERLLQSASHLCILASSREALAIAGETTFNVPSLSTPEFFSKRFRGPHPAESMAEFESVRLFVERGAAAKPGFALTDENARTIAKICWRLDGIPLAIELAAARVKMLALGEILNRLDDRFHLLTSGGRTALPRQQTLTALIDWSYDLLSEKEQALLRRLSVFGRGRTLEAVEKVCSGDGIERSGDPRSAAAAHRQIAGQHGADRCR